LQGALGYSNRQWKEWLTFLHLYLAMEEWFHESRPKNEVRQSREAIGVVIEMMQRHFPRTNGHGYNLPKMHGLTKMQEYFCLFGCPMNFYGGPGEASHKLFVKAPGLKTQRRVSEFAAQVAEQYYNTMAVNAASKYIDIRLTSEKMRDENNEVVNMTINASTRVSGQYRVFVYPDGNIEVKCKNEEVVDRGLDERLLHKLQAISFDDVGDDESNTPTIFRGYTWASVVTPDGEIINYNAHPFLLGKPWYDWSYVYYEVEGADGTSYPQFYPSKILGFVEMDKELNAVILCSVESVPWSEIEENFVVRFSLCADEGEEQIVPLSALSHPICVVPDYGAETDKNAYLMVLPKGQWAGYFSRFIAKQLLNN
jgi:hypothetical protein